MKGRLGARRRGIEGRRPGQQRGFGGNDRETLLKWSGQGDGRLGKDAGRQHEIEVRRHGIAHPTIRAGTVTTGPGVRSLWVVHRTDRALVAGPVARTGNQAGRMFVQQTRPDGIRKRTAQESGLARQRENRQSADAGTEHTHLMSVVQEST
jgi:hypothetical protein